MTRRPHAPSRRTLLLEVASGEAIPTVRVTGASVRVTWRIWANAALTIALMALLILEVADLVVLFMVAFVIALLLNIRTIEEQQELIERQAVNAVPVMMLVLAAGIFTGIMTDAGMIKAMADAALSAVPDTWGNLVPLFTALLAHPLGFFMSNDAYWFGVVPVLAASASHYGIHANEIARAGAIGQILHSTGPTSAPPVGPPRPGQGRPRRLPEARLRWGIPVSFAHIAFALLTGAIGSGERGASCSQGRAAPGRFQVRSLSGLRMTQTCTT